MSVRSERGERQDQKLVFSYKLKQIGINFPDLPSPDLTSPNPWLIRAESRRPERLLNSNDQFFQPQLGEYCSFGVFLAACTRALPHTDNGVFYVFKTAELAPEWLVNPSGEWTLLFRSIASQKGLDPQTISGGYRTEEEIYRRFPVFQKKRGVCTLPSAISALQASLILTTSKFFDQNQLVRCSNQIKNKLLII